jgi:hypothetical protein
MAELQISAGLTVTVLVLTPAALDVQSKYSAIRAFPRFPAYLIGLST